MKHILILYLLLFFSLISFAQNWESFGSGLEQGYVRGYYWEEELGVTFIVGTFKMIDSVEVNGVCMWDGENIIPMGTGMDNCNVGCPLGMGERSISKYKGEWVFGMSNETIDSVEVNGIAKWDGENWKPLGEGVFDIPQQSNGAAWATVVYKDTLFVGGSFDMAGQDTTFNLAKWDGENWHKWEHSFSLTGGSDHPFFYDMIVFEDKIYIAGNFDTGFGTRDLVSWDGEKWEPIGSGIAGGFGDPSSLFIYKNELHVIGNFENPDGVGYSLAKLKDGELVNVGGGFTETWARTARAVVINDILYIGGTFNYVQDSFPAQMLVAWDGEKWCDFGADFYLDIWNPQAVLGWIGRFEDELLISGNFKEINGEPFYRAARWTGGENFNSCSEPVSAEETFLLKNPKLFPNPSSGNIQLLLETPPPQNSSFQLFDNLGRSVFQKPMPTGAMEFSFDLNHLPKGIYFYEIQNEGKQFGSGKLVLVE